MKKYHLQRQKSTSPFKLQLISFLKKFEPEDNINVSETLLASCSILLNEYFKLSLLNLSIL